MSLCSSTHVDPSKRIFSESGACVRSIPLSEEEFSPTIGPMNTRFPQEVTRLLSQIREGDEKAGEQLVPLVYEELKELARIFFSAQPNHHTLQPTALVHEAWVKISPSLDRIEDRTHFLAVAARAMRQILADHARTVRSQKRYSGRKAITLIEDITPTPRKDIDLVLLDDLLVKLADLNRRHAKITELRLFGSLTIQETARVLDVSERTVVSDWKMARRWLRVQLAQA